MEIILELLTEKRVIRIEWGQILGAVMLALLLAGLCRHISVYSDEMKENMKEHAAPVEKYMHFEDSERIEPLLGNFLESYDGRISPEIIAANSGQILQRKSYAEIVDAKNNNVPDADKEETGSGTHSNRAIDSGEEKENTKNMTVAAPEEAVAGAMPETDSDISENADSSTKEDVGEGEENTGSPASVLAIELYGNGGTPEKITDSCNVSEFSIENYEIPTRMGKLFDGWFCDKECKQPFSKAEPGQTSLVLYAGWKEFPGFLCNDKGYITGYTDASVFLKDHLLVLPRYDTCVGVEKSALKGLEEKISEIYIPANISYIESGVFDDLTNLIYIEVNPKNSKFYSRNGILYYKNGDIAAFPQRMQNESEED